MQVTVNPKGGRKSTRQLLSEESVKAKEEGRPTLHSLWGIPSKKTDTVSVPAQTPVPCTAPLVLESDTTGCYPSRVLASRPHDQVHTQQCKIYELERDNREQQNIIRRLTNLYEESTSQLTLISQKLSLANNAAQSNLLDRDIRTAKENLLSKSNEDLTAEIDNLNSLLQAADVKFSKQKQKLEFFKKQPPTVHALIQAYENGSWDMNPLRQAIIESSITNTLRERSMYSKLERDFWLDCFNNMSHRQFNRMSEVLNGPWPSTVESWQTIPKFDTFGLNWSTICSYSALQYQRFDKICPDEQNEMDSSSIKWGSEQDIMDTTDALPHNCMIDETPCKIIVQFDPNTRKLYGFSAMPRFVLLRNIEQDFNVQEFFNGLKLQYDKKVKRSVEAVVEMKCDEMQCLMGYAQFESHADWQQAISMDGKNGVVVETIESFPSLPDESAKIACDKHFAEAEAIGRPRSTYVYSLAINSATIHTPVTEIAVISTNNRYLQNQDHKLYTYNLTKMMNFCHIPMIQFVADGDARFRNQMLTMTGYCPNEERHQVTVNFLANGADEIVEDAKKHGWKIPKITGYDVFHYFFRPEELKRSHIAMHLNSSPHEPFSPDLATTVRFYIGLRCCMDVFCSVSPVLGGIPRTCCQDQCHWLRKRIKSSLLSTKPLLLGNYVAKFSDVHKVYESGPEFGLIKRDIDINNKSDQKSVERIISDSCMKRLEQLPWAKGTLFLVNLGKVGFEAWWKTEMSIVDRIQSMYYVTKAIRLWELWVDKSGLDSSQHFITKELMRDTIVMASGMVHLAIVFKLYFPNKPFLPWKWSEYPLESYYSCIRFLNGNDDEFSTLEYMHRTKRILTQQIIAKKGLIKGRAKKNSRDWCHPREVSPENPDHLRFFAHTWTVHDLLKSFEEADICIQEEF